MLNVSSRTLKNFSALFWYIGGFVLMIKGSKLVFEADELNPGQMWPWLAFTSGLLLGGFKAKFLFSTFCQKNLARIETLEQPTKLDDIIQK